MTKTDIPTRELGTVRKNAREEIRVSLDEFQGHLLVNLRVFFEGEDGQRHPGKQGIAFKVALLPEVLAALHQAEAVMAEGGAA